MKPTPRSLVPILCLTLLPASFGLLSAQQPGATAAPPANPSSAASALSPDERAHLRRVQAQVLAGDPALKAEDDTLRQQRQDMDDQPETVTPDARKAFFAKWREHQMKIRMPALKLDPTLAPIYAKVDAWRQQHAKPATGG